MSCEPCIAAVEPIPNLGVLAVLCGPRGSRPLRSVDADVDSGIIPGVDPEEADGAVAAFDGVTDQSDDTYEEVVVSGGGGAVAAEGMAEEKDNGRGKADEARTDPKLPKWENEASDDDMDAASDEVSCEPAAKEEAGGVIRADATDEEEVEGKGCAAALEGRLVLGEATTCGVRADGVDGVLAATGDVASTMGGGAGEDRRVDRVEATGDGADAWNVVGLRGSDGVEGSGSTLAS